MKGKREWNGWHSGSFFFSIWSLMDSFSAVHTCDHSKRRSTCLLKRAQDEGGRQQQQERIWSITTGRDTSLHPISTTQTSDMEVVGVQFSSFFSLRSVFVSSQSSSSTLVHFCPSCLPISSVMEFGFCLRVWGLKKLLSLSLHLITQLVEERKGSCPSKSS